MRRRNHTAGVAQRAFVLLFIAFMLAPLVVVMGASLEPRELLRFPPDGLSLRWYRQALQDASFVAAAWHSLVVGVLAALGALLLGVPAAYALARRRSAATPALSGLFAAPLLVPELVIGVALLQIAAAMGLPLSLTTVTVAHVLICLPYVVRTVHAAVQGIEPVVEEAAASLGAGRLRIYLTVILPLVRPALMTSLLFAFLISFDNTVMTMFLGSSRSTTLPIAIYSYVTFNLDPMIAAISTLLIIVSVLIMMVARMLGPVDRIGA
ncbi:ABC transporter permease [Roseomonas gilardii]|uniref:ABC transporter permease n=1 Tax=Roseomonas gilardii TaxID=257708 RepID=UPI0011A425B1|nr:ABC transporter permease [Roseomonas gilardii]